MLMSNEGDAQFTKAFKNKIGEFNFGGQSK